MKLLFLLFEIHIYFYISHQILHFLNSYPIFKSSCFKFFSRVKSKKSKFQGYVGKLEKIQKFNTQTFKFVVFVTFATQFRFEKKNQNFF